MIWVMEKPLYTLTQTVPEKNKFLDSLPDTPGPFGPADFKSGFLKFAKHSPVQSQVILVSDTFPWFKKSNKIYLRPSETVGFMLVAVSEGGHCIYSGYWT